MGGGRVLKKEQNHPNGSDEQDYLHTNTMYAVFDIHSGRVPLYQPIYTHLSSRKL